MRSASFARLLRMPQREGEAKQLDLLSWQRDQKFRLARRLVREEGPTLLIEAGWTLGSTVGAIFAFIVLCQPDDLIVSEFHPVPLSPWLMRAIWACTLVGSVWLASEYWPSLCLQIRCVYRKLED